MDEMEMRTLSETARIVEKMADFAGDVIIQLFRKQDYVEKQGIRALLDHIAGGGGTLTTVVSALRAEELKAYVKKERIPFVEIEHVDPQTKERSMFFVYRDSDREAVQRALKQLEMNLDQKCHEVDVDTFIRMNDKKPYGMVKGLTRTEVYAFREAAKAHNMIFCVMAEPQKNSNDKDNYVILCSNKDLLYDTVAEMSYNLSGERGSEYSLALEKHFEQEKEFVEKIKPEPGRVKYVVNSRNPSNFITVDEQGITTHSVGKRSERGEDGVVRDVIYDARHVIYPGFNKELLKQLALELRNPIVLSAGDFPLVQGLSKTKEAILAEHFMKQYKPFIEANKSRKPDYGKIPVRRALYVRENLIGLGGLPMDAVKAITLMELPEVYVDGCDVAYPKDLDSQIELVLEAYVYKDMPPEEKVQVKQELMEKEDNAAITYMLQIEANERDMLKVADIPFPEVLNSTQKEALVRLKEKDIKQMTMNKDMAKILRERDISRRMEQDMDR